ncbi:MAG: hypothetical protein ACREQ9_13755 [Candidatus Binatia bacterium]
MRGSGAAGYDLYGMRIRSEVPLSASPSTEEDPDLEVRWGARGVIPSVPRQGTLIARCELGDGRGYAATETAEDYVLRYYGTCEFRLSRDRRRLRVHLDPGAERAIASVLLGGTGLAFVLTLRGECVLHASAVEVDGSAVALLGPSGAGKSTLAALLCGAGAALVTDDLLRLVTDGDVPRCFHGTDEIRLRSAAADLGNGVAQSVTPDRRLAIRPRRSTVDQPPLRTLLVPRPDRSLRKPAVRRLDPRETLLRFLESPRIPGWTHPETLRSQFAALAGVARSVTAFEVSVPWGPPFPAEIPAALLDLHRSTIVR